MKWKRTQSNALLIGRRMPWKSSMRVFSLCAFFSVGLSASFCSASEIDETNAVLRIEDLTPETRVAISNLAVSLSAASANANAATVEDNVQAILTILQNAYLAGGQYGAIKVVPYTEAGSLGRGWAQYISRWLSEDNAVASQWPTRENSLLYEIQRALYGQSGVPSSSQAILPVLWRLESALTNNQSSVDMGWTNSVNAILTELNGSSFYGVSLSGWLDENLHLYPILESIEGYFSQTVDDHFESAYSGPSLAVYDAVLSDVWEETSYRASLEDSALRVVDANVLSALLQLDQTAQGISYEVSMIANRGPQVVVISNLQELIRHIDQVTNYQATAHDEYQAAQFSSSIADEESDGQEAFSDQMEYDVQETSNTLSHSEPDYEVHYTDNPMSPLATAVDFSQTMRRQMPDVSSIDTKSRIYLFKTDWDEEGLLSRRGLREISVDLSGSDPHVPNQFYNYCERIMSWAWNLAALVAAFALFRDFWNWVASWRA